MKTAITAFLFFVLFACVGGAQIAFSQAKRPRVVVAPKQNDGEKNAPDDKNSTEKIEENDEVVRVETSLVTVPVSVTDKDGRYVPDLQRSDFRLFENNVEQEIAFFASVDEPFTVLLLLDTSGSVTSSLDSIKSAAKIFVRQLRPNDRAAVITFARDWHVLVKPTVDRERVYRAIDQMTPEPWTRLYDTVDYVLANAFKDIEGRKAVLLLTDGVDVRSNYATAKETVHRAEEGEAAFYTIRYESEHFAGWQQLPPALPPVFGRRFPFPIPRSGRRAGKLPEKIAQRKEEMQREAKNYLENLAEKTGGRYQEALEIADIEASFAVVAEELRHQYILGFYPAQIAEREEKRQLKVRVSRPNIGLRARTSYIAKPQK